VRTEARRDRLLLAAMVAAGSAIRLWIGFTNRGVQYDVDSAYAVAAALKTHPLHVYDTLRWAYPGGFLPIVLVCRWIADATGAVFYGVIKLPLILADAGLTVAVWWGLARSGASRQARLAAAALVAFGPSFVLISGYHAQMDPAAILPAVIAVLIWERGSPGRALPAGLLIGLATSFKTVPLFMVLALLPTARSRREAAVLTGAAIAVPLLATLPFLLADTHNTVASLKANRGVPGWGGISLFVQPRMIHDWLHGILFTPSGATRWLVLNQNTIVGVAVLLAGAVAWRRRMNAVPAAALIWAAVYVANPDWSYQYFIWGLPFFLLAGMAVPVAGLQALLALPAAELYFHFGVGDFEWLYLPLIYLAWLWFAAVLVRLLRARRATAIGAVHPGTLTG
jgi:hypothetical protein